MMFYLVCGWSDYYPRGGIQNILLVTHDKDKAENFVAENIDNYDNIELFNSNELPWG
jgi:hypothetical protein